MTTTSSIYGSGKGIGNRPAITQAAADCVWGQSRLARPNNNRVGFSIVGKQVVLSSVSHLLPNGYPLAIVRRVGAIIVNSIDGHAGRRLSHILNKINDVLLPPIANINASAAIVFILWVLGVIASIQHGIVNAMNGASGIAMPIGSLGIYFFGVASTTDTGSVSKLRPSCHLDGSAITTAQPVRCSVGIGVGILNDRPSPKSLAGQIFSSYSASCHEVNYISLTNRSLSTAMAAL